MRNGTIRLDLYERNAREAVANAIRRQEEQNVRRELERHLRDPHCGEFLASFEMSRRFTEH
ncbi:hypothetical protein [Rhodanobacter denitrificans]|uniref:Uncharacterized protein n=1 Tax=Rhodanobacter denitrificans TaxID=666685 RepID=M4NG36_9GAMM|nr:hypothetical protein [Rhodanobacter denitrificans]AGG89032.1 hypothetical protein R2APBS1_1908 [Rhodanobacter denitrificans]UJJ53059.1 hypothetical protein LRK52_18305 [Rhodanobacter denitrificans]